jgi:hypothetical protein
MFFAPAGLAVQDSGDDHIGSTHRVDSATPIGQGYFLVRSRLRITQDGGQSLLAVRDNTGPIEEGGGPNRSYPSSTASLSSGSLQVTPNVSPLPSDYSVVGHATSHMTAFQGSYASPALSSSPSSSNLSVNNATPNLMNVPSKASYTRLSEFLREHHRAGIARVIWGTIGVDRRTHPSRYPSFPLKLKALLQQAEADGVVVLGDQDKPGHEWASSLIDSEDDNLESSETSGCSSAPSLSELGTSENTDVPARWCGLVAFLRESRHAGHVYMTLTQIGVHRSTHPHRYSELPKKMKELVVAAQSSGLVTIDSSDTELRVELTGVYLAPGSQTSGSPSRLDTFASSSNPRLSKPSQVLDQRFGGLVSFLRERLLAGTHKVEWTAIGANRGLNPSAYPSEPQKLKALLELAREAGVVECGELASGQGWAKLAPAFV